MAKIPPIGAVRVYKADPDFHDPEKGNPWVEVRMDGIPPGRARLREGTDVDWYDFYVYPDGAVYDGSLVEYEVYPPEDTTEGD
jgi:hypothetical protein